MHSPSMSSFTTTDVLRHILDRAEKIKQLAGANLRVSRPPPRNIGPIPVLRLPFPDELLILVDSLPLPSQTRQLIKSKVTQKITHSQQFLRRSFKQTCEDISNSNSPQLQEIYEQNYQNRYVHSIREELLKLQSHLNNRHNKRKPIFNVECTPLLEKYFEYNAYPSAPDRRVLASKTKMTARQIEVWFQNHRNRAKKEGKTLKRLSSNIPNDITLQLFESNDASSVNSTVQKTSIPLDCEIVDNNDTDSTISTSSFTFALDNTRPPHAFPTRYPARDIPDPFPCKRGEFEFPPIFWRRATSSVQLSSSAVNMDEFIAMFASKLHLRDGSSKSSKGRQTNSCSIVNKPWFTSTTTLPCPAPHPALVRTPTPLYTPNLASVMHAPSLSAFGSPSTFVSSPTGSSVRKGMKAFARKITSLSKHLPKNAQLYRYARQSPVRQSSSPRSISGSSIASFQSRTASYSSDSISPPATPSNELQDLFPSKYNPTDALFSDTFYISVHDSLPVHQPYGSRISSFASVSSFQSESLSISTGSSPEPTTPPSSTIELDDIHEPAVQEPTRDTYVDLFSGIVEPQFHDFSQNLDFFLNKEDIFTNKHLPSSTPDFPYLDPLFAAT